MVFPRSWLLLLYVTCLGIMSSAEGFSAGLLVGKTNRSSMICRKMVDADGQQQGDKENRPMNDLDWRVAKLKLEEANTRRFLKAKPRYLPYVECRKWVKAFGRWKSEDEWKEWINEGEKRNSYIPARPDEYYGSMGKWINWDHFLGLEGDDDITPGQFD